MDATEAANAETTIKELTAIMGNDSQLAQAIKKVMLDFDKDKSGKLDTKEGKKFFDQLFYGDASIFNTESLNKGALNKNFSKFRSVRAVVDNDQDGDLQLDTSEIKELCKKMCAEKIAELQKELVKYKKKKELDEKRLEDLRIEHYLQSNVMPLLLESMGELAKSKPENPIEFIAKYLLKHNPEKVQSQQ
jgi:hypothetical protein